MSESAECYPWGAMEPIMWVVRPLKGLVSLPDLITLLLSVSNDIMQEYPSTETQLFSVLDQFCLLLCLFAK